MIIPKAIFLHYKYRKEQNEKIYSLKQECQRIMGSIVNSLRCPDLHKKGEVSHFFPSEQCQLLCQKINYPVLNDLLSHFKLAGYEINADLTDEGLFIYLSWKSLAPLT